MKATRTIPGRPINAGETVANMIVEVLAATLDRSPNLDAESIRGELAATKPVLALLASGGHLRRGELVLVAPGLRLRIDVPVGEQALTAEENKEPARGVGTAKTWTLHLPQPDGLAALVRPVAASCANVSIKPAPDSEPVALPRGAAETINLSRLAVRGIDR